MDVLGGLMTGSLSAMAGTPGPTDDFWYGPAGAMSQAGLRIDSEGAKKISAWFRGRDILATSLAMLPLVVYRRLPNDEGREAAPQHPLHDILHRKPSAGADAFQYKRDAMFDVIDHGWHFAEIMDGPRGVVDQLERIDPRLVTPEKIKKGPFRGRWLFHVRDEATAQTTTRTQDEMFYLRGADGKGILDYARDSLGLGKVLESYGSALFSRGAMNGGLIEFPPGPFNEEAVQTMARSFVTKGGDWHVPKALPNGAKWHQSTMEPEKAQFILSRKFTVVDIARWLGLPAHMLNEVDTAGVTGLEQKAQEFVTFSMGGWLSMWEFGVNDQLILNPATYYAEFTRDALARGDLAARWAAHVSSVNSGIVTPDEARVKENLPKKGGKASELRDPQNITGRGAIGGAQDNQRPGREGEPDPRMERAEAIAQASAGRLLRKEITAVQKLAVRHAADGDAFAGAVAEFYAKHAELVATTLQLSEADAEGYCSQQAAQIVAGDWLVALEQWESPHYAAGLAAIALDQEAA